MDPVQIRNVLEACLLVAGKTMSVAQLQALFGEPEAADDEGGQGDRGDRGDRPDRAALLAALASLQADYEGRGIELVEVASGWRLQSRASMEPWVARLFQERPPRYSRALLETLVLIAYRQPITRGEIEQVRGVAVSSNIIRTLQEREWVREVGHKEVPGRPALLGTTRQFLDYFNLKRLEDLPPLGELKDLDSLDPTLAAATGDLGDAASGAAANDASEPSGAEGATEVATGRDERAAEPSPDEAPDEAPDQPPDQPLDQPLDQPSDQPSDQPLDPVIESTGEVTAGAPAGPSSGERSWDDPQARLRRVIDRFAAEHREDLRSVGRWPDPEPVREVSNAGSGSDAAALPGRIGIEGVAPDRDDDVP